jgi:hypothetical protein
LKGCGCFLGIIYAFLVLVLLFIGIDQIETAERPDKLRTLGDLVHPLYLGVWLLTLGVPCLVIGRLRLIGAVLFFALLVLVLMAMGGLLGTGDCPIFTYDCDLLR